MAALERTFTTEIDSENVEMTVYEGFYSRIYRKLTLQPLETFSVTWFYFITEPDTLLKLGYS